MTKIRNLFDLIEFPKEGILSKTITEKPSGEVSIFMVPKGEKISSHTSSRDATVQIIRGEADWQLGDDWNRVKPGDWFFMPAGLLHAVNAVEDLVFLLTLFGQ
ncbi:MAG: cupin domain-containing protein [Armatimonadota bacterium]